MEKIAVVYWSGTGNTAEMANSIADGAKAAGAEVDIFDCSSFDYSSINSYSKYAFGCPSMGDEVLEESEFEPFFTSIEKSLGGKKVALFGSYGWGDGQWMRDWQDRIGSSGASLFNGEGLIINNAPDASGKEQCSEFGKGFAAF